MMRAAVFALVDAMIFAFVYPAAALLRLVRRMGVQRLPLAKRALLQIGVFPIRDHYYEPLFSPRHLRRPLNTPRQLPGIDWHLEAQLEFLRRFHYAEELADVPVTARDPHTFFMENGAFGSGDAEYWYSLIRLVKPKRILEIGSGYSTLMAVRALRRNSAESAEYQCRHVCIEPYEAPWLEQLNVSVVRERVENLPVTTFSGLSANDILFIDSSHVIRPQGDVLFEYLEVLPVLQPGVIVHIHDIFSPRDYPADWITGRVRFFNEQYLLEAFLSQNRSWRILGALNLLSHNYFDALKQHCPFLTTDREPGSFYIQRVK